MEREKTIILKHPDGEVDIEDMPDKKRRITVRLLKRSLFMPRASCETFYPVELVRRILTVKGPAYLCDEILRDEDPSYVRFSLEKSILAYTSWRSFENKRILDFGCGCGASTMNIARIFPRTQVVGVELDRGSLSIAESRLAHYDFRRIDLWYLLSSSKRCSAVKFLSKLVFKTLKILFGVTFVPYLSLAIKKENG